MVEEEIIEEASNKNIIIKEIKKIKEELKEDKSKENIWEYYNKILNIREHKFCPILNKLDYEDIVNLTYELIEVELEIYNTLYTIEKIKSAEEKKEIYTWLETRTKEIDKKIKEILANISISPLNTAFQLQSYEIELLFIKKLALFIEKDKEFSILPDIFNEIYYLVNRAAEYPEIFKIPFISKKLSQIRTQALYKEIEAFKEEIERILTKAEETDKKEEKESKKIAKIKEKLNKMWDLLHWSNLIQPNMSRRDPKHIYLKKRCKKEKDKIKEEIKNLLDKLPIEEKTEILEKFSLDIQERADEIILNANNEEVSLANSIKSLEAIKEDVYWIKNLLKTAISQNKDNIASDLKESYKKIKKIYKYLRAELQEKKLQERLENIFGRKFVAFFENLILFLILVVIVLLTVESFIKLSPSTQKIFFIIDAGICGVFLLEFFTKLYLSEGKILYFWRHLIIDFLPSIPFGLITSSLQNLDYARSARVIRLLRLPRLIRYVRVLRPIIRIFRVITFLLRGLDRLVNRYSKWLNRSIIFFGSPEEINIHKKKSLSQKIQEIRGNCLSKTREIFRQSSINSLKPFIVMYLSALEKKLERSSKGIIIKDITLIVQDILIEDLLETLLNLKGSQVEEIMGREFPYTIHQYIGYLNAPLIKHIPGIKIIVKRYKEYSPPEFTAWLGRALGRILERGLALIYWFTDLYGIVTGPRLLDKIASTLIDSFKRPAKRLLIIGSVFIICNFLLNALSLPFLSKIVSFLDRYVGTPLIVIGGVCLIPLGLGIWLKNIASEATEFYERTAEAQFINLLKDLKIENAKKDLKILYKRVIKPEIEILNLEEVEFNNTEFHEKKEKIEEEIENRTIEELLTVLHKEKNEELEKVARITSNIEALKWKIEYQVLLLYKDYLDGAPLHKSDVKTTEQLLGNITLGNIRIHKLGYTKKDYKELEKLDLERHRIFTGPYLWFSLITQSIAHNTAQLIIDYNKNCIPQSIINLQPLESQLKYKEWIKRKKKSTLVIESKTKRLEKKKLSKFKKKNKKDIVPLYLTTQFTALHFLTADPSRDYYIAYSFGQDLFEVFKKDRRELIRNIFGTYPLNSLPKIQRSVNPYQLYQEYMSGGRIFLLPFKIIYWIFKGIKIIIKWIFQKIKEIIKPLEIKKLPVLPWADFNVAIRKINRMRKPIYLACMKLRAQYDFEYLGLKLPYLEGITIENDGIDFKIDNLKRKSYNGLFEKDLDYIKALDHEYDYFYELRKKRKEQLNEFDKFLKQRNWDNDGFTKYLESINKKLVRRKNEILRALAIAYTIDYRKIASLINAQSRIEKIFEQTIKNKGKIENFKLWKKILIYLIRVFKIYILKKTDWEKTAFNNFWEDSGYSHKYSKREKRWCWLSYLANSNYLKDILYFINEQGDIKIIDDIIQNIIRYPSSWTEELIALRTIQTLSIMDVRNYREHIYKLGEYDKKN